MSLSAKKRDRPRPVMNVTPLVDVVLVLLIIFMVVIPMMESAPSVSLPNIFNADEDPKSKADPYTLSITSSGETYFEEQLVAASELAATLTRANEKDVSRRLILRADRAARYVDVRKLFRVCQGVGFPGVAMRVNSLEHEDK
jgi:biopolymer transport protein TolR